MGAGIAPQPVKRTHTKAWAKHVEERAEERSCYRLTRTWILHCPVLWRMVGRSEVGKKGRGEVFYFLPLFLNIQTDFNWQKYNFLSVQYVLL